jgi:hypothetical protein
LLESELDEMREEESGAEGLLINALNWKSTDLNLEDKIKH